MTKTDVRKVVAGIGKISKHLNTFLSPLELFWSAYFPDLPMDKNYKINIEDFCKWVFFTNINVAVNLKTNQQDADSVRWCLHVDGQKQRWTDIKGKLEIDIFNSLFQIDLYLNQPPGWTEASSKEPDDEADWVDHQEARQQRRRNNFARRDEEREIVMCSFVISIDLSIK